MRARNLENEKGIGDSFPLGRNLRGRLITGENGHIELDVVIDENTRAQDLREAWREIDTVRERIREHQGDNLGDLVRAKRLLHLSRHREGFSYQEIVMEINYDCLVDVAV